MMELILPERKYYLSYVEAEQENKENHVIARNFLNGTEDEVFAEIERSRTGIGLPKGWVKATYLWLVEGNEFIGEVSIRHELTEELLRFGGNIGYGVRPSKWKQGIGTKMLSMALLYARNVLGLEKVLITCDDNNTGSARVIEKNGGVLWDKIEDIIAGEPRVTRRYWLKLNK